MQIASTIDVKWLSEEYDYVFEFKDGLAAGDGNAKSAILNTSNIYNDGKKIRLTAYTINGNNYFKLRDIGKAFNIGVNWDGAKNTISLDTAKDYIE